MRVFKTTLEIVVLFCALKYKYPPATRNSAIIIKKILVFFINLLYQSFMDVTLIHKNPLSGIFMYRLFFEWNTY